MKNTANQIIIAAIVLFFAVAIGAFGAHGLKAILSVKAMATFKTGNTYHFYHGLALLLTALIQQALKLELKITFLFYLLGILIFSGLCYAYALTQVKIFAMIVPIGGVLFLLGHLSLAFKIYKVKRTIH